MQQKEAENDYKVDENVPAPTATNGTLISGQSHLQAFIFRYENTQMPCYVA